MNDEVPNKMHVDQATKKLKICIVYSRVPFPMMRGDQLTISHLIQFLYERGHSVDFITLKSGGKVGVSQMKWLQERCNNLHILNYSLVAKSWNLFIGILKGKPFQVSLFSSSKQKRILAQLNNNNEYDIIYTYYIRSAEITSGLNGRKFLALQLSQYLNTKRIYDNSNFFLLKWLYWIETHLIKHYESSIINRYGKVGIIGEKDLEAINNIRKELGLGVLENYVFAAHGTDISKFNIVPKSTVITGRVVFSGNMSYEPNIQAVHWFVENCWSSIKAKVKGAEFFIVGKEPVNSIKRLASDTSIHVTGTVDNPFDYIKTAQVCVNPMLAAGGMQNKLIEYMASGKVVVASEVANEGIRAVDKDSILIANTPDDFISQIAEVLKNPEIFESVALSARRYIENNWTWQSHFMKLEDAFYSMK